MAKKPLIPPEYEQLPYITIGQNEKMLLPNALRFGTLTATLSVAAGGGSWPMIYGGNEPNQYGMRTRWLEAENTTLANLYIASAVGIRVNVKNKVYSGVVYDIRHSDNLFEMRRNDTQEVVILTSLTSPTVTTSLSLPINYNNRATITLYSFGKADNSITLIPCRRKADLVEGLYDIVGKAFYVKS